VWWDSWPGRNLSVAQMPMPPLVVIDYAEAVFDLANTGD
jgi:hypothetical protein